MRDLGTALWSGSYSKGRGPLGVAKQNLHHRNAAAALLWRLQPPPFPTAFTRSTYKPSTPRSFVQRALEGPSQTPKIWGHGAIVLPLRKQSLLWTTIIFFASRQAARWSSQWFS